MRPTVEQAARSHISQLQVQIIANKVEERKKLLREGKLLESEYSNPCEAIRTRWLAEERTRAHAHTFIKNEAGGR